MNKDLFFILMILLLFHFSASAQKKKIEFHSINQFAMVGGESQMNTAFQTINGIIFSDWFSGIGIGIDNYRYKTLPLFMEGRWFFGDGKNGFIYGDIGYDFPMKNKPGKEIHYYDSYHFTGGVYTDIGIGYKTPLYRKTSLLFSLGYSYKELQTKIGITPACVECQPYFYNYKYGYGRIVLKTGVEF
jgi:hypothetical protein